MTMANNRAAVGEGTAEPREIRAADDGIIATRSADAPHCGSALMFQVTEMTGGELLVTLTGEIDASNSSWLLDRLTAAITGRAAASGVVVELSEVGFCDASGINVLVNALKQCRRHQGALELAGAHGRVARVLRLTGVDRELPLYTDPDGALHAIARHRSASAQALPRRPISGRWSESGGDGGGDGSGAADVAAQR